MQRWRDKNWSGLVQTGIFFLWSQVHINGDGRCRIQEETKSHHKFPSQQEHFRKVGFNYPSNFPIYIFNYNVIGQSEFIVFKIVSLEKGIKNLQIYADEILLHK